MVKLSYKIVKKRNDSVIKKPLSVFMASICLLSSVSTSTFAGKNEEIEPQKTFDPYSKKYQASRSEKVITRKAFLAALLCAVGIDVYIKLKRDYTFQNPNFTVMGIENFLIEGLGRHDNTSQMKALVEVLKKRKDVINFNCDSRSRGCALNCVKINNYFLTQTDINKIGEKVLGLIYEKRKISTSLHGVSNLINLTENISIRQEIINIFGEVLNYNPYGNENSLKFYKPKFDINSKDMEPITNINHINYMNICPEDSYSVISCYHKAFFVGFLSALGIDVKVKTSVNTDCESIDRLPICGINGKTIYAKEMRIPSTRTENMINITCSILPCEKFQVETSHIIYTVPTKVKIGDITLDETDVFNLGKRFYNLAEETISCAIKKRSSIKKINLDKILFFTESVKREFKEYTGRDFPNLKSE